MLDETHYNLHLTNFINKKIELH